MILYKALGCDSSFAMMRRLFAAVVKPTVAYGCEIWGTLCVGNMVPELRKMADVQLAFYRQTLRLRKAVPGHLILAELDEVPWVGSWWSQILGFLQKLGDLAGDALHAEILRDNVHDARMDPSCGNWAAGAHQDAARVGGVRTISSACDMAVTSRQILAAAGGPLSRQDTCTSLHH